MYRPDRFLFAHNQFNSVKQTSDILARLNVSLGRCPYRRHPNLIKLENDYRHELMNWRPEHYQQEAF